MPIPHTKQNIKLAALGAQTNLKKERFQSRLFSPLSFSNPKKAEKRPFSLVVVDGEGLSEEVIMSERSHVCGGVDGKRCSRATLKDGYWVCPSTKKVFSKKYVQHDFDVSSELAVDANDRGVYRRKRRKRRDPRDHDGRTEDKRVAWSFFEKVFADASKRAAENLYRDAPNASPEEIARSATEKGRFTDDETECAVNAAVRAYDEKREELKKENIEMQYVALARWTQIESGTYETSSPSLRERLRLTMVSIRDLDKFELSQNKFTRCIQVLSDM